MKDMIKKNKELIIAIAVVLILIVTGSYAWLTITETGEKVNVIKAGTLSMTLDDSATEGIALINAIPQSYQQGILGKEYTFTLKNDSTSNTAYSIYLDDQSTYTNAEGQEVTIDNTNRLGDNNIRFILLKNGEVATPEKSMLLSQDPGRLIDTGTVTGNETITYSLRIWIDSKTEYNDAIYETEAKELKGKVFNGQLRVEAVQAG